MTEFDLEVQDIYNQIMYYPSKIYEIFCDFFGEEYVDLQNTYDRDSLCSTIKDYCNNDIEKLKSDKSLYIRDHKNTDNYPYILVWFPKVKITNEYDESVEVENLWAKIDITYFGKMRGYFRLNRSTYLKSHVYSDYMHSHVCGIYESLPFQDCCLGTGPIKTTILNLQMDYDESLWQLFCYELSKYVPTESVSGVPYRKLSSIKEMKYSKKVNYFKYVSKYNFHIPENEKNLIISFTKYFLDKKLLKFNYFNNSYGLGMSFIEYMLTISNCFIEYYNDNKKKGNINISTEELYNRTILEKVKIADNSIYKIASNSNKPNVIFDKLGETMFTFKGRDIKLEIIDDSEETEYTTILSIDIATAILNSILKTFNYYYGTN